MVLHMDAQVKMYIERSSPGGWSYICLVLFCMLSFVHRGGCFLCLVCFICLLVCLGRARFEIVQALQENVLNDVKSETDRMMLI